MHWFWRAVIAVAVGGALGTPFIVQIGKFSGPLSRATERVLEVTVHSFPWPFGIWLPIFFIAAVPVAAGVATYGILARLYGPRPCGSDTRCRKCSYILRGISEPRCPECGEQI
ncbi:MAG: hypothetical protein AMXMBFR13_42100 [Phycisphaerae bacterium]